MEDDMKQFGARVLAFAACMVALSHWAGHAGTTGTLSVKVLDAHLAPVAQAKVSATSPSQSAVGLTDAGGFFGFINLSPDTYSVSASKEGFTSTSVEGVTVQADQTTRIQIVLQTEAKLLGRITTTGQAIVNKSVTGDLYSVNAQTMSQYQGSMGGSETLNSQYGVISSLPGVVRTIGTGGGYYANNLISIRGGTPDQIGFELEGIPLNRSFDKYNGGSFSMNGVASVELYTGGEPADAGYSMAGFVNEVIQRGSYPGGVDVSGFIGSPAFNHTIQADIKGGSPNGRLTYFVSTLAINSDYRYGNASNLDNTSISIPANDPGCPLVNFINGSSLNCAQPHVINLPISQAPLEVLSTLNATIRNTVTNVHFAIPHGQLNDDLQMLYMVDYTGSPFPYSGAGIDPNIANASNAQGQILWPSGELYTGAVGQLYNPAAFKLLTWPSSGGSAGPVPSWYHDGQTSQQSVEKISYTHLFSPSSFLRFYVYGLYSLWGFDQATNELVGGIYYTLRNNTTGATATYQNQFNEHNLLRADVDYEKQVGLRYDYTPSGSVSCGNLSLGPGSLTGCAPGDTVAQIQVPSHEWNDLPEIDSDAALADKWQVSEPLLFDLGIRFDRFQQVLTPLVINGPNGIAEQSQNQFGVCLYGYAYASGEPCFGYLQNQQATSPASYSVAPGAAAWQDVSGSLDFSEFSPRFGVTYTLDPADVVRASIGRYVESPNTAYQEYVGAPYWGVAGTVDALNNFYQNFGFLAVHNVQPEDSTNYDLSFEHQFSGGWGAKISPYYRITRNQILNAPANPAEPEITTGFNFGAARIQGVEFLLGHNRAAPNGLNATLAATYNDAKIRFERNLAGHNFIDAVNGAIAAYNAAYGTKYALFDPNGYYSPSVTESPQFLTPSYDVRWTANLGLDEHFAAWDLTPTFNYQSGNPYGDPLGFPDDGAKELPFGPDPYTHTFDGFGSLVGPSWVTMNLGLTRALGSNTKGTVLVTNLFTAIHNHGYPWEFPTRDGVLAYGDNNFYYGFPFSGSENLGENYYPYAPFSVAPTSQWTFIVTAKM
jgi:outer membrane receptor protein involved in Fe transport